MTQLVYLNVLISLYEFNIWLDGYIWWKFCVNSPLRNPLTDKNADVSNTYFPRCIFFLNIYFVENPLHAMAALSLELMDITKDWVWNSPHRSMKWLLNQLYNDLWSLEKGGRYILKRCNSLIFHPIVMRIPSN